MKFVFALAIVAVCVLLMHARPNVKRNADADAFKINKRNGDGGDHEHGSGNGNTETEETTAQKEEEIGEGTSHTDKRNGQSLEGRGRNRARKLDKILKRNDDGGDRQHVSGNGNTETEETTAEKEGEKEMEIGEGVPHTHNDEFKVEKRGATSDTVKLWKDGRVAYKFVPETYGKRESKKGEALSTLVKAAAEEWKKNAGVNIYLDQNAETDVIEISDGAGCWSWIGYQGSQKGKNKIVLDDNTCFDKGVILHEMGHAIGFMHEAQRMDRNAYIGVFEENIDPKYKLQFAKSEDAKPVTAKSSDFEGILDKYDYCSIMHYSQKAFSKNEKNTIGMDDKPLLPCLGGHDYLSILDGEVMAFLYGNLAGSDQQKVCKNKGYMLKSESKCVCGELFEGVYCETPITDSCGTSVNKLSKVGDDASFSTPTKSGTYPLNYKCEWQFIVAPENTKLCIGFPDGIDIEQPDTKNNCAFDYVQLIDDLYFPDTERYCGKEEIFSMLTKGDDLVVRFNSDDQYPSKGFQGVAIVVDGNDATEEECKQKIVSRATSSAKSSDDYSSYSSY